MTIVLMVASGRTEPTQIRIVLEPYLESTHNDISKYKEVSKIKLDYDADLNWIRPLAETPIAIKEYVLGLIKEEKIKAALKAYMSKRAVKRRKVAAQTVNFNGPINGGTINNISNSKVHCTNDVGFFFFDISGSNY